MILVPNFIKKLLLFALVLGLFCSFAVAEGIQAEAKNINKIEYRFHDSSVPPPYHRSYSIILTSSELRFVVDSYGQVIKDTTVPISLTKWEESKRAIDDFNIRNVASKNIDSACKGGTGISIKIFEDDVIFFQGHNQHCAGQQSGDLGGDTKGFLEALKSGIAADVFVYE